MKTMRDYLPVDQDDDSSDLPVTEAHNSSPLARRRLVLALVVSNVLTASALFFFLVSSVLQGRKELNGDLKRVSYYSPILDQIEIPIETVMHDNTLFRSSIYRQDPSPEVDEAWFKLTTPHEYLVSAEDIIKAGKDPKYSVRHPTKPDKHVTMLAVDHQLHCLNDIRKNVFASHYWPNTTQLLRQTLMCNANLDLITYNWQDIGPDPVPDFTVNMKCRNFDVLRTYQETNPAFFSPLGGEGWPWKRQGDERTVPAPREWWETLLEAGFVSQGEFDRGKLDEGHDVVDE